ncbi:MAG: adenylate/guanylate cyclase domain-containing protein, partial [Kiloniellales bacterium]|nr:adenylate/guanylate cyclase domain-containing protein [Kiloniellales bacterium]
YELDRLQLVEKDEAELMARLRKDYDRFIETVMRAIELTRSGQIDAARELQSTDARARANRLERLTNQLVNVAEANMLDKIAAGQKAYEVSRRMVIAFSVGSAGLALLLGYLFSSSILNPLTKIQSSLGKIAKGDFEQTVAVRNRDELGALADDVNQTSRELGSLYRRIEDQTAELAEWNKTLEHRVQEQVSEIERMARLRRFLSPQIAEIVISTGDNKLLSSHRALIAVIFGDMRGFTAFCDAVEPEEAIEVLQTYHEEMSKLVFEFKAGVDQRTGDGIMVIFNDPVPCDNPAGDALRMAIAMRDKMAELCKSWRHLGQELGYGVGITLGYATVGMVGSEGRYDYAANGTAVNLAARLCDEARDGEILLNLRAYTAVEDEFSAECVGELNLKGIRTPVEVYRLLDSNGENV